MMSERDDRAHAEILRRAAFEDVVAHAGMVFHRRIFIGIERALLEEDRVGDSDLADVVHRRGEFQNVHGLGRQSDIDANQR